MYYVFFVACMAHIAIAFKPQPPYADAQGNCRVPQVLRDEIKQYQPIVQTITDAIVHGEYAGDTWKSLSIFIEKFGPRKSGSAVLEKSIDYMVNELKLRGLENVHTENAPITRWERVHESALLLEPYKQNLNILGLGTTVGTPQGGIVADVIVVESFKEFEALSEDVVRGNIVLFVPKWTDYSSTLIYRTSAASVASKKGAIAALVRSLTPFSIGSPHTGDQEYEKDVEQIPVASVTVEDAYKMLTMYQRGTRIVLRLEMEERNFAAPATSRNTISELQGSVKQDESVVVLAGHLDSWDVGNGAMDDAGGSFITWKAIEFLKKLDLRPKRTIRSIMWTGEEEGYQGALQYHKNHVANEKEFNFFMESDEGTFEPFGLSFTGNADGKCLFNEIIQLMGPLNATATKSPSDGLSDVELWTDGGWPASSLMTHNEHYFYFHHTAGDSMLVQDPVNLDKCTAIYAAVAYVVADMSVDMPKDLK